MVHAQKTFAEGSSFIYLFGGEMKEQEGMSPNREPPFPFELGSFGKDEQLIPVCISRFSSSGNLRSW